MTLLTRIGRQLKNAMTVADLIEALQNCDPDAVVVFGCDYGDHCHTEQALPVSTVDELDSSEVLTDSGYSNSGVAIHSLDDEDTVGDEAESDSDQLGPVVVLR